MIEEPEQQPGERPGVWIIDGTTDLSEAKEWIAERQKGTISK